MRRYRAVLIAVYAALFLPRSAIAHEIRPAYLELNQRENGVVDVIWKAPVRGNGPPLAGDDIPHESDPSPAVDPTAPSTLPCGCPAPWAAAAMRGVLPIHPSIQPDARIVAAVRVERVPGAEMRRWSIDPGPTGLSDATITIHGLEATMTDVLVRIALADGHVVSRLLRPGSPSFVIPQEASVGAFGYLRLGIEHILLGIDHLLFVLGLLLIVRGVGPLVKTITAFTLAHSVTLGLATLGLVTLPQAPVEAVIALSIVFLASELLRVHRGEQTLTARRPWLIAFLCGLLHGFGFAGALQEVGLPRTDIPLALLMFNIGVEVGQLIFVGAVLALVALAKRLRLPQAPALRPLPAYVIGTVAAFWMIERIAAFA